MSHTAFKCGRVIICRRFSISSAGSTNTASRRKKTQVNERKCLRSDATAGGDRDSGSRWSAHEAWFTAEEIHHLMVLPEDHKAVDAFFASTAYKQPTPGW